MENVWLEQFKTLEVTQAECRVHNPSINRKKGLCLVCLHDQTFSRTETSPYVVTSVTNKRGIFHCTELRHLIVDPTGKIYDWAWWMRVLELVKNLNAVLINKTLRYFQWQMDKRRGLASWWRVLLQTTPLLPPTYSWKIPLEWITFLEDVISYEVSLLGLKK